MTEQAVPPGQAKPLKPLGPPTRADTAFAQADEIAAFNRGGNPMRAMATSQPVIAVLLAAILEELQKLNANLTQP